MKKVDFTQAGGFPFEEKTADNMQTAYFDVLKTVIGHFGLPNLGNFIIYGCEVVGNNITAGMLYMDGELCYFSGASGNLTTKIKKVVTIENAPFEVAGNLPTYYDFSAFVNSGGVALSTFIKVPNVEELVNVATNWADVVGKPQVVIDPFVSNVVTPAVLPQLTVLERLELLEKKNAVFTAGGGMVLWNKPANEISAGWHEVVNWKGRIPVGVDDTLNLIGQLENPEFATMVAGQIVPGRTNGSKKIKLLEKHIPKHSHKQGSEGLYNTYGGGDYGGDRNWGAVTGYAMFSGQNTSSFGGLPNGDTEEFSILNPFRTVVFIEYTGI